MRAPRAREVLRTAAAARVLLLSRRVPPWRGYGEPFNGQAERTAIITELVQAFGPDVGIETGTFFGFTAAWMAEFTPRVYTIERDLGFHNVARLRLRSKRNVTALLGDSAVVLPELAATADIERPFVYLDAHWGTGLPLATEVETTLRTWPDCLIVVDDFLVPHDSGYDYDIYDGKPLSLEMLSLEDDVTSGFPALPATEETGARRGTLFLGRGHGGDLIAGLISSGRLSNPFVGAAASQPGIDAAGAAAR
jgi:predicted O-methyltransferase YrrM